MNICPTELEMSYFIQSYAHTGNETKTGVDIPKENILMWLTFSSYHPQNL